MLHTVYLAGLCSRRSWPEPYYQTTDTRKGYSCIVTVNNREYQTSKHYESQSAAKEAAALTAYTICRSFSVNDGMYPTGFGHSGVIQGTPVPVGSGRRHRAEPMPYTSSYPTSYRYRGESGSSSGSGGSSPDHLQDPRMMQMRRPPPMETLSPYESYIPHRRQEPRYGRSMTHRRHQHS